VRWIEILGLGVRYWNLEAELFLINGAMVNRALVDPRAIDESDPTSMRRAVELALGRCPARFAELV
jgi:hypothetical protein